MFFKHVRSIVFVLLLSMMLSACGGGGSSSSSNNDDSSGGGSGGSSNPMTIASTSFSDGGAISSGNACLAYGGGNQSPQFTWTNAPAGTQSFVLIMDDETSPCGTGNSACVHWAVYNIPSATTSLEQGVNLAGVSPAITQGQNYASTNNYEGPCAPRHTGTHTYNTTIYALSEVTTITTGTAHTRSSLSAAFSATVLGSATISGTFAAPPPFLYDKKPRSYF